MNINKPNDNKNMGQIDYGIFYTLCILLSIGVIMVYSASSFYAMFHNNDSMYFFKRQLIWAIIGIISMSIMMSIDYHKLKKNYTATTYMYNTIINCSILLSSN